MFFIDINIGYNSLVTPLFKIWHELVNVYFFISIITINTLNTVIVIAITVIVMQFSFSPFPTHKSQSNSFPKNTLISTLRNS